MRINQVSMNDMLAGSIENQDIILAGKESICLENSESSGYSSNLREQGLCQVWGDLSGEAVLQVGEIGCTSPWWNEVR
jgi:hypothetical protein